MLCPFLPQFTSDAWFSDSSGFTTAWNGLTPRRSIAVDVIILNPPGGTAKQHQVKLEFVLWEYTHENAFQIIYSTSCHDLLSYVEHTRRHFKKYLKSIGLNVDWLSTFKISSEIKWYKFEMTYAFKIISYAQATISKPFIGWWFLTV